MLRCVPDFFRRLKPRPPCADDWQAIQAQHHWRHVYQALLGAVAIVLSGWLLLTRGAPPTQSDIDARALLAPKTAQPFRPIHPIDPRTLSSIDMAKIHGRLLPAWTIALQHNPHSIGRRDAEHAFGALREEAGNDPNLGLILDQLHEKLMAGTYDFRGDIQALVKGWNDYLAQGGVPFRVEHHIEKTIRGPELRVRCYRVVADVPVSEERFGQHVLLLARQDHTDLVEAFLGQTSADRATALVMTDRIAEFAIDRIWPLLETYPEESEPELFTKVRQEVRHVLDESAVDLLARTFTVRRALETELSVLANRRGCGGGVLIERVPWDGLSHRALAMVNGVAKKNESRGCSRVTLLDANRISAISRQLHERSDLEQSLGLLAGWFARAVVVHEVRHLGDESAAEAGGAGICPGCPQSFDYKVRAEVSAYLASFETQGVGYVALLQACGVHADRRESHAAALEFLLPKLLVNGCEGPIPDDLYARAAAVRSQLFGRNEPVTLPKSFPRAIPVPRG